jgi:DNA-binding MarR family transcriptional regulator
LAVATPARAARSRQGSAPKRRAGSSRTSRRQQDVLRLVKQRPGITVREIARELGVDATGLYRPVHKLEQDGAITKRGVALQPGSD